MSKVEYGQVEVDLEEPLTLQPTLRAYERIDKKYGGLAAAIQPLSVFSMDAIVFVVSVGAKISGKDALDDLKQQIFDRGVSEVAARAIEFVTLMMNPTGRSDDEEDPEGN